MVRGGTGGQRHESGGGDLCGRVVDVVVVPPDKACVRQGECRGDIDEKVLACACQPSDAGCTARRGREEFRRAAAPFDVGPAHFPFGRPACPVGGREAERRHQQGCIDHGHLHKDDVPRQMFSAQFPQGGRLMRRGKWPACPRARPCGKRGQGARGDKDDVTGHAVRRGHAPFLLRTLMTPRVRWSVDIHTHTECGGQWRSTRYHVRRGYACVCVGVCVLYVYK